MRVRVKVCGITRVADAQCAVAAGVDALGLVFHAASRRCVDVAGARGIVAALPPFVSTVALFVDAEADAVWRVVDAVRPDLLQFHGSEEAAFCARFGVPYLKVLRVGRHAPASAALAAHPLARGILLDTLDPAQAGGTGRCFDWSLLPARHPRPLVLAGGLDAANVGEAIRVVRPYAVDVSSGVESAPGIKDPARIEAFMRAVRRANEALPAPAGEQHDELA
jgi:phosphoribosylanthranilate isomerase